MVSSPEDTILAKVKWAKLSGGSERQYRDTLRAYEVQRPQLDHDYLRNWATRLSVTTLLDQLYIDALPSPESVKFACCEQPPPLLSIRAPSGIAGSLD